MRTLSIRAFMGSIVVLAVELAALRNADEVWAGAMLTLAFGLLGVAVLCVAYTRGRERAGWFGFLTFGGGSLMLVFGPGFSEHVRPNLITTQALDYVQSRVDPTPAERVRKLVPKYQYLKSQLTVFERNVRNPNDPALRALRDHVAKIEGQMDGSSPSDPNPWRALLPGAMNAGAFLQIGHCLVSLLAGLAGAMLAVVLHTRRERSEAGSVG